MTEERLNNAILLHVHKEETDQLNLKEIASEFVTAMTEDSLTLATLFKFLLLIFCTHLMFEVHIFCMLCTNKPNYVCGLRSHQKQSQRF